MALIGRLHPVLVHFPIALVILAAFAEGVAILARESRWHFVAIVNIRAGAFFAVVTTLAGWLLARTPSIEPTPLLTWHRWLGTMGATLAVVVALASGIASGASARKIRVFRIVMFATAALVAVTGHLGGLMVWGTDWFHF